MKSGNSFPVRNRQTEIAQPSKEEPMHCLSQLLCWLFLIVLNVLVSALPSSLTKFDISATKLYSIYQQYQGCGKCT